MDEKQISELLECSVCLERFDQTCKVLPCQHTFCRQCLDEIILTKHELRCPECRALVTVRVSDLPTNILVVRILEGLKTKGHHRHSGYGVRQHSSSSLSSSPSKGTGSGQTPVHDTVSSHLFRQGTQPCVRALYNYDSSEKNDLPFKKGDVILLRRKIDDNWFHGEIGGRSGFFPANFVQVLVPLPQIPQCITLYDFDLKDEGEKDCLSFKRDEMLTVIRRVDENWLEGRKGDKIGIFPITFVKLNEAARSLINSKSNLTILPSLPVSSNLTTTSSSSIITSEASSTSSSTSDANVTTTTTISTTTPTAGTSSSTVTSNPVADIASPNTTTSVDDNQTLLTSLEAVTIAPSPDTLVVSPSSSQPEPIISTTITTPSTTSAAPEVLPQNKRHSFTSTSLSSPISSTASSDRIQQRHSAEITFTDGGMLSLVNSDNIVPLSLSSSSLPTSVTTETEPIASQSPKNNPSSPVTTSEAASSVPATSSSSCPASSSSSCCGQTGSLTTPLYIALYNYKPRKDDELELHRGDHYTVVEKCQDGWYKGSCLRSGQAGVFPGNYVQLIRHSSAFKPVSSSLLNVRVKCPTQPAPNTASHCVTTTSDQQPVHVSGEAVPQAPPLLPRVAKMSTAGQMSRSPLSHLTGAPLRSLSSPGTNSTSTSPKHMLTSQLTSSPHIPAHIGLSRPLIPAPPPSTTSSDHHYLWVPPNMAAIQHSMSASSNITPPNVVMSHCLDLSASTTSSPGKEKKEKKEKEKKGLVKLLSGKSKKSKQAPADPDPAPPLAVVCFDSGIHFRSGSYPVNGTAVSSVGAGGDASIISAHRKAASFDATTVPPIPAKPRPKLTVRERYCCIVPYPPQTEHELSLELGDIIHVHRKRDDGWYKGTQERTGKTGMFPASFVEKCD